MLAVDLGVAATRGVLWRGRCARQRASAVVWSRRAGAEEVGWCGGHGAASPQRRVCSPHGDDPCGRALRTAMAWSFGLLPLGSTSTSPRRPSSE